MEGKAGKRPAIGGRRHERARGVVVRVKRVDRDEFQDTLSATKGKWAMSKSTKSAHMQQRPAHVGTHLGDPEAQMSGTEGAEAAGT